MMKHAFDAQNLSRQAVRFLTLLFLVYVHVIVSIGTVIQKQSNLDMAYYMFICIFLVLIIMDDTINKNLVILTVPTQRSTGLLYNGQAMLSQ